jgi:ligand-binding SRPBCC domain-containing protein
MRSDTFVYRSRMLAPASEVFAWHMQPGAFLRFAPPWERIRLIADGYPPAEGARAEFDVPVGPIWRRWTAEHRDFEPGRQFRDVQVRGPFARWEQRNSSENRPKTLVKSGFTTFKKIRQLTAFHPF